MNPKACFSYKQSFCPINSLVKPWLILSLLPFSFSLFTFAGEAEKSLDWIPIEQLNNEQRKKVRVGCCGAYIAPERNDTDTQISNETIKVTAGNVTVKASKGADKTGNHIELIDQVDIIQGNRYMQADKAIIDETNNNIKLQGDVILREPNLLVNGDKATVNRGDNTITVNEAQYVIHSINTRGSAKKIEKVSGNRVILTEGSYTQCSPEDNSWLLKSDTITIDNEKQQGYAKNVQLVVKDVPVFYFPYLQFPLGDKRQSGFLSPSISSSEGNGIDISIPFYLNLVPNYDLILTPHFLDDHGLLLGADARHLNRYFYTETTLVYLNSDKGGFGEEAKSYKGQERWLLDIQQQGGAGQAWSSSIDYAKASDEDYLRDLDKISRYTSDEAHLSQYVAARYDFQNWQVGVETQKFQSLIDENEVPYQQLPLLHANGYYEWNDWSIHLNHEWIRFDNESEALVTGDRTRLNYVLSWDNIRQGGFFKPALQLKHLRYALDNAIFANNTDKIFALTVPQTVIDTGLFFERDNRWLGHPYQQTFEPRLYYLRSKFKDQTALEPIDFDTEDLTFSYDQLFRDTRFSGGDRIGDANQLSVDLTTRFIDLQSGREWLSLSAGRIFYFDDRRVTLTGAPNTGNSSDIASRISSSLNDYWQLTSDILYDPNNDKITSGNIGLKYRNDNRLLNLDYRYVRDDNEADTIKQLDASLIVPLYTNRWYFIGQNGYDMANSRKLETLAGFEYNDCCYRIRFAWRQSLDSNLINTLNNNELRYDRGWFIQVQLRGLGGTGTQLDGIFDNSIDGYSDWQAKRK